MSITFTRAVSVAEGDPITATEYAKLAAAINDRLVSGLGDGTWRIFFYFFSLFRQVRNSSADGMAFPSMGEFFEYYQHIDPTEYEFPLAGPGDAEGANLASVMNAFVFGAEAFGLDDEATRLAEFPWDVSEPSVSDAWELAKAQRGAWDPITGGMASPAFNAARAHWRIRYNRTSPHGNSYGGYSPTPTIGSDCADDSEINYEFRFTNLVDGSTTTYPGSCSENSGDVAGIVTLPWAYYVVLNDGTVDILQTSEWVEGPYTGEGRLMKQDADGISRMLNKFASEYRGSNAQRLVDGYHLQNAFDFQRFANKQYRLAPAVGTETEGLVSTTYPSVATTKNQSDGYELPWNIGGTTKSWADGSVLAGYKVRMQRVLYATELEFVHGTENEVWRTITLPVGDSETITWIDEDFTPVGLRVRCKGPLIFDGSDGICEIEFLELMRYKPNVHDYALFLRIASVSNGTPDGVGTNETQATEIGDGYFSKGCLWNINGKGEVDPKLSAVNRSAIWDAARRFSRCVRLIRRQDLWMPNAYAVEDGKSVLWFRRRVMGLAGAAPDAWDGIGPSVDRVVSGDIKPGYRYECRTTAGAIYNGRVYQNGERFTGVVGVSEYEGECWEADGIRRTAPNGGYSNRWLLGCEFKPFRENENSIWKPSVVADYFPIQNRCHLDGLDIGGDASLRKHFAFGETASGRVRYPESPSGYNYAELGGSAFFGFLNANGIACDPMDTTCIENRLNFYKSCRIYEPDVEIESVEWEHGEGNDEVIKVTLTGRLHHCDEADDTISRDSSSWDIGDLQAEPYRSHENAIREYIVYQTTGTTPVFKIGDQSSNGALETLPDNPVATIYPTFRLTQLIPEPYQDGRYTPLNPSKTRCEHDPFVQMELYLRAMCEGYVDGETTQDYACESATISLFDFTWESLCVQATGNRWINSFPWSDSRDNRQGHGPLPNTEMLSVVFNQFVEIVNKLDTVRVMLPCNAEKAVATASLTENLPAYSGDGSVAVCGGGQVWRENTTFQVPIPDFSVAIWEPAGGGHDILTSVTMDGTCSGDDWVVETGRDAVKFRFAPTDDDLIYALPESWRDQFNDKPRVLVTIWKTKKIITRELTDDSGEAEVCGGFKWPVDGSHWLKFPQVTLQDETVCLLTAGEFEAPPIDSPSTLFAGIHGGPCLGGPENRWAITLLAGATAAITIELV